MKKTVIISINDPSGIFCVDIIKNIKGKFSFKSFRCDLEDNSGWYPFGPESGFIYNSAIEAKKNASKIIPWII